MTPSNQAAASIDLFLYGDTIVVSIGDHGSVETWHDDDGEWLRWLDGALVAVAEGKYAEEVRSGWLFERKVKMSFPGSGLEDTGYWTLSYGDVAAAPPLGEHRYPPW